MAAPVDLPMLPAFVEPPPPPQSILEQPNLEDKEVKAERSIEEETFSDIDPGVFDNELIRQKLYAGVDDDDMEGNITEGTYTGTQAAITHVYRRIERSYESFMDVMQIEPTLPRLLSVEEKKSIYRWSAYPTNADGTTAQYPPHLEVIPESDQVSANEIFGWLHLKETQLLVAKLIPDTFGGKTFNFVQSILADKVGGKPMVGTLRQIEEYNRNHRKSGTDIEAGKNLGLLPDWYSDRRFADQSFTGTNPTTITAAPADLFGEFQSTATRTGEAAWAEHLSTTPITSFYVQDTRRLREALGVRPTETLYNREPLSDDSWACAAVTLFELHPTGRLHPVAITIDYQTSMADSITIFNRRLTPTSPSPVSEEEDYPWRYAKTCAQVTDFLRHEVVVHLTQAHFIEEALVVATHRTLPMTHPVFKLLQPHWYKTLSLNAAARATLVPQVIKDLVGIKPEAIFAYIRHEFESFDYVGRYVPNDLAARGFPNTAEGLAEERFRDYAYAKNMVPMWEAIRRYVGAVLGVSYANDAAVSGDAAIAAWCVEVQTKAGIRTFPRIQTVAELADAVTMAIHIAAPFHTAVNYLQNFYHAFVPAKPPCLCAPMPTSLDELKAYGERELVRALPVGRQRQWLLAVQVPWLLSNQVASERNLVTFAHSQWRTYRDAKDREGRAVREASKGLYGDLRRLDVEFAKTSRAMNDGAVPYNVMDPDSTAVSILI